jgi:ribosome modulation factor
MSKYPSTDKGVVARYLGREARHAGSSLDTCPYDADSYAAKCWRVGWRQEDAAHV